MKNKPETATPEALNPASAAANLARLKALVEERQTAYNAAQADYTRINDALPLYLRRLMDCASEVLSIKKSAISAGDASVEDAARKAFVLLYAQEQANPLTIEWRAALSKCCEASDAHEKAREAYDAALAAAAVREEGGEK